MEKDDYDYNSFQIDEHELKRQSNSFKKTIERNSLSPPKQETKRKMLAYSLTTKLNNLEIKNKLIDKNETLSNIHMKETLSVYTVTWNLYGKKGTEKELINLIPKNRFYHIYAIGTEECMRSILVSLFYSNKSLWEKVVQYFNLFYLFFRDYLGDDYTLLKAENLSAIHLMLFVHKSMVDQISCK